MDKFIITSTGGAISENLVENASDLDYMPEEYIISNYTLKIHNSNENDESVDEIGFVDMTYYDIEMAYDKNVYLWDIFDDFDTDKQELYMLLFEDNQIKDEYVGYDLNIMYIDKIFVNKEYRNKGIASRLLEDILNIIRYSLKLHVGCIALSIQPFEMENGELNRIENDAEREKLKKFYGEFGFESINDTKFMIKKLEEI